MQRTQVKLKKLKKLLNLASQFIYLNKQHRNWEDNLALSCSIFTELNPLCKMNEVLSDRKGIINAGND